MPALHVHAPERERLPAPCLAVSAWMPPGASSLPSSEAKSWSSLPKLSPSCPHPGGITASSHQTLEVLPDASLSFSNPVTKSSR